VKVSAYAKISVEYFENFGEGNAPNAPLVARLSWDTANNSVLQPLDVLHNNILRIMTLSNYGCHVTPLYKNLNVLKLNDIYRLELAKFMHKLHHGALPKIFDDFFKNISNIQSYKTRFADNQNYFMQRVCKNSGKKVSLIEGGAAL